MQEMQRPDGSMFQELFTELQVRSGAADRRRKLLEKQGMQFKRLVMVDTSKYQPHQSSREIERRVRQALRQAAKQAEVKETA